MVIPLFIGRQMAPPLGYEYKVLEREGFHFAGGSVAPTEEERVSMEEELKIHPTLPIQYPVQIPLKEDLIKGYLWVHFHIPSKQFTRFMDKVFPLMESEDKLLVIVVTPTVETEEALLSLDWFHPDRYKVIYLCTKDFGTRGYCVQGKSVGRWYDRERERRLFGAQADLTILPFLGDAERDLYPTDLPQGSQHSVRLRRESGRTEIEANGLRSVVSDIKRSVVVPWNDIFREIKTFGQEMDLSFAEWTK